MKRYVNPRIREVGEAIRDTPRSRLKRRQFAAATSTHHSIYNDHRTAQAKQIQCDTDSGKPISGDILAILTRKKAEA